MPTYVFRGRNSEGKLISGKRSTQSADNLSRQLIQEGIVPIQIDLEKERTDYWDKFRTLIRGRCLSIDEFGIFSRQMYTLIKAGVPITSAFKQLAQNARSSCMSNALNGIVANLESGKNLATAMQDYSDIFSPLMISIIHVGESSGRLEEAFLHIQKYLELEGNALKSFKAAIRYPLFVVSTIVLAIVLINIFVIPAFAKVYEQLHATLPWATLLLIKISQIFRTYWLHFLIAIGFVIGGIYYYLHTPQGKLAWGKNQLKIPIIGNILRRIILLRFSQIFAVTINSGIGMTEGIGLVSQAITNTYARSKILLMQESVTRGKSLTHAASEIKLFSPIELQMLAVGEETGELGKMLEMVADYHQREVEYDLKRMNDYIEPLLIIILSVMILILAFAVYLPIWNMVKLKM